MKKILVIVCIVILVIVGVRIITKKKTHSDVDHNQSRTVEILDLGNSSSEGQLFEFVGTVKATESLDLVPESAGKIIALEVDEGDVVTQGKIIARLENTQENLSYQRALASLESQKITLRNLEKEFNQDAHSTFSQLVSVQEGNVSSAYQGYLNNDLRAYPFDDDPESVTATPPIVSGTYQSNEEGRYIIDMYRSAAPSGYSIRISGLESGIYSASTEFPTPLGTRGLFLQFSNQTPLREQSWVIDIPNKRSSSYLSAKNAYEASLRGKDLTLTQSQVTEDDLAQQRNVVRQMQLAVQEAGLYNEKKIIRAPFDGELISLNFKVGEFVSGANVLGSFKNLNNLELEFFVAPLDARFIRPGSKVLFQEQEVGSVYFVAAAIDEQGKIKVRATLDDVAHISEFTEGSTVSFHVESFHSQEGEESLLEETPLIIPLIALQMKGNEAFIASLDQDQKIVFVPVRTGLLLGDMIEIRDIPEEITVIVADARGFHEGDSVLINTEE